MSAGIFLRVAEMLASSLLLFAVVWLISQTRWSQQRPAFTAAMWMMVLIKCVVPWGPSFTLHYSMDKATAVLPMPGTVEPATLHVASLTSWQWFGMVAFVAWATIATWRISRRLVRSHALHRATLILPTVSLSRAELTHVAERAAQVANRMGLVKTPLIVVSDVAVAPCCVGLVQQRVVVPRALLDKPDHLDAALAHEFAHLARYDLWQRAMQLVIVDVLWFFPVVHIASRRLDTAREAACDAKAVASLQVAPSAYAKILIDVAAAIRTTSYASGLSMGGVRSKLFARSLHDRIAGLAMPRSGSLQRSSWMLMVVLAGLATLGVRASAVADNKTCYYSSELANQLLASHPEADTNADGELSRDEVCGFEQAAPSQQGASSEAVSRQLLASMCCNCQSGGGTPSSSFEVGPQIGSPVCVEGVQ
jgi:beta-lactamase regulating signal transducer with metallopeptidase domain